MALAYPLLDFTLASASVTRLGVGHFLTKGLLEWFRSQYTSDAVDLHDTRVSPLFGDLENLPPTLVIVGEFDPLLDEATRLSKYGNVEVKMIPGMIHGFLQLRGLLGAREEQLDSIFTFLVGHLQ